MKRRRLRRVGFRRPGRFSLRVAADFDRAADRDRAAETARRIVGSGQRADDSDVAVFRVNRAAGLRRFVAVNNAVQNFDVAVDAVDARAALGETAGDRQAGQDDFGGLRIRNRVDLNDDELVARVERQTADQTDRVDRNALRNVERFGELIEDIRCNLPKEIRQARAIAADRNDIIADYLS